MQKTVNKVWFKNRLKNGELLVRCVLKQSDDYAYDAATNYSTEKDFRQADKDMFSTVGQDWYIRTSRLYGDKDGLMKLSFASCEYWEFKLK